MGLAFILLQKKDNRHWGILQVGSSTLKGSQQNWYPSELELLAVDYLFTKKHFITYSTAHSITIFLDCSGLKNFESMDLHYIKNKRFMAIRESIQCYNYQVRYIPGKHNEIAE